MTNKLSVLYLDLNAPDLIEDYAHPNPKRYGGARAVVAPLRYWLHNNGHSCEIWANPDCFKNIPEAEQRGCVPMSQFIVNTLKNGGELKQFLRENFIPDIVLHNFPGVKINCKGLPTKDLVWLVGYGETINPENERAILYNQFQHPKHSLSTKIYYAKLGVPIPEFRHYEKEPFIFSCHRQDKNFGSKMMIEMAVKHKINYLAAGPKDANFPNIMDFVDNHYVTYLGEIPESTKIGYFQRASASTYLHTWACPHSLSSLSSLSYGTPCIASSWGWWPHFIEKGVNGYIVNSEEEFLKAWENCKNGAIKQLDCYNSVKGYSESNMIEEYMRVFETVLQE